MLVIHSNERDDTHISHSNNGNCKSTAHNKNCQQLVDNGTRIGSSPRLTYATCLAAALPSSDEAQKSQRAGVQRIHRWAAQDPEAGGRQAHAWNCQEKNIMYQY